MNLALYLTPGVILMVVGLLNVYMVVQGRYARSWEMVITGGIMWISALIGAILTPVLLEEKTASSYNYMAVFMTYTVAFLGVWCVALYDFTCNKSKDAGRGKSRSAWRFYRQAWLVSVVIEAMMEYSDKFLLPQTVITSAQNTDPTVACNWTLGQYPNQIAAVPTMTWISIVMLAILGFFLILSMFTGNEKSAFFYYLAVCMIIANGIWKVYMSLELYSCYGRDFVSRNGIPFMGFIVGGTVSGMTSIMLGLLPFTFLIMFAGGCKWYPENMKNKWWMLQLRNYTPTEFLDYATSKYADRKSEKKVN